MHSVLVFGIPKKIEVSFDLKYHSTAKGLQRKDEDTKPFQKPSIFYSKKLKPDLKTIFATLVVLPGLILVFL